MNINIYIYECSCMYHIHMNSGVQDVGFVVATYGCE